MPFFDYDLPPALIAQRPSGQRDQSRLLRIQRASSRISHHVFRDLPELLRPGDLLILNNTKVLPARLRGRRERTGGRWEGLFLHETADGLWEFMCQSRRPLRPGEWLIVEPGPLRFELIEKKGAGNWLVRPDQPGTPAELLARYGRMPLPHYIRKGHAETEDTQRYQTVFAEVPGAVAAPTAGLHFTSEIFERLQQRGIGRAYLTLHVGLGTFQPIRNDDFRQHVMHKEWGELPAETAAAIRACQAGGGRIVAVGTTSVRVLETVAATGSIRPWTGETDLYIYPPFEFRAVDALITNFHLPRSTLLLLVGAYTGEDMLRQAYESAIAQAYRFYSYGDAMMVE
ncbi:MAG TPA: tRNA preQ1(34) S-adenosylmethionine ribosyltransferase-isomerase QueA [Gemmataceae bacterium]|jgi:S-adenosylmethionine:tRNA ribosyltransferase-isomerase|nr:tRNA preQ1(34) S-adenosylmethionine ribosyltransferase-isomerase QueA [Gemmataceae bacterium]